MRLPRAAPGVALLSRVDPAHPPMAAIFGLKGPVLDQAQRDFFREVNPLGFILLGINDNIQDKAQLAALNASLHDCMGRTVPILIDQEGGRVARLRGPHWPEFPAAKSFGDSGDDNALAENTRAIARMLKEVGVNVNCAPVLDVLFPETHGVIGDRAFSDDPVTVGRLGATVCRTYLEEGVIPVVKHLPGHGRATADTHKSLAVVDASLDDLKMADLAPYRDILQRKFAKSVWGMVAHVVYRSIDSANPATCSPAVMRMIRQDLGFDGFLLTDDIVMGALSCVGDMGQRAAASIRAGCDAVLHCNGAMDEMEQVAKATPAMSPEAVWRFNESLV